MSHYAPNDRFVEVTIEVGHACRHCNDPIEDSTTGYCLDCRPRTSSGEWTPDIGEVGTVDANGDPVSVAR